MDVIDHISARVTLAASVGAFAGVFQALYRGHQRMPRTAGLTALSWALSATACVGTERLCAMAMESVVVPAERKETLQFMLATHALGGVLGGSLLGALYLRKPLRGALFFTPIMVMVGFGERRLQEFRQEQLVEQKSSTEVSEHPS